MPETRTILSNGRRRLIYEADYFSTLFEILAQTIAAVDPSARCWRTAVGTSDLHRDVVTRIATADVVLAVVTGRRSDVFWQLGIRHALRDGTIVLQDRQDDSPLGLLGYFSIEYNIGDEAGVSDLKRTLEDKLRVHFHAPYADSPVRRVLGNDLTDYVDLGAKHLDLFISYSSINCDTGRAIAINAKERQLAFFIDEQGLDAGARFENEIRYALLRSRELCVLVTPEALRSEWVTIEWGAAWALQKRITPILLGCSRTQLPRPLAAYHAIDYQNVNVYLDEVKQRKELGRSTCANL